MAGGTAREIGALQSRLMAALAGTNSSELFEVLLDLDLVGGTHAVLCDERSYAKWPAVGPEIARWLSLEIVRCVREDREANGIARALFRLGQGVLARAIWHDVPMDDESIVFLQRAPASLGESRSTMALLCILEAPSAPSSVLVWIERELETCGRLERVEILESVARKELKIRVDAKLLDELDGSDVLRLGVLIGVKSDLTRDAICNWVNRSIAGLEPDYRRAVLTGLASAGARGADCIRQWLLDGVIDASEVLAVMDDAPSSDRAAAATAAGKRAVELGDYETAAAAVSYSIRSDGDSPPGAEEILVDVLHHGSRASRVSMLRNLSVERSGVQLSTRVEGELGLALQDADEEVAALAALVRARAGASSAATIERIRAGVASSSGALLVIWLRAAGALGTEGVACLPEVRRRARSSVDAVQAIAMNAHSLIDPNDFIETVLNADWIQEGTQSYGEVIARLGLMKQNREKALALVLRLGEQNPRRDDLWRVVVALKELGAPCINLLHFLHRLGSMILESPVDVSERSHLTGLLEMLYTTRCSDQSLMEECERALRSIGLGPAGYAAIVRLRGR